MASKNDDVSCSHHHIPIAWCCLMLVMCQLNRVGSFFGFRAFQAESCLCSRELNQIIFLSTCTVWVFQRFVRVRASQHIILTSKTDSTRRAKQTPQKTRTRYVPRADTTMVNVCAQKIHRRNTKFLRTYTEPFYRAIILLVSHRQIHHRLANSHQLQ